MIVATIIIVLPTEEAEASVVIGDSPSAEANAEQRRERVLRELFGEVANYQN